MNHSVLLALLSRCRQVVLDELESGKQGHHDNATVATPALTAAASTMRKSYDNAYFYILFVMFFYSFLALALFKSFVSHDKSKEKDPYEEFISKDPTAQKFNTGPMAENFNFEEENSL